MKTFSKAFAAHLAGTLAGWCLAVSGILIYLALLLEPIFFMPAEDAVILWAYSRNLALHGSISYIAGGPHTEGATDFAWMVTLSGLMKLGFDPFIASNLVSAIALFILSVILIRIASEPITVKRVLIIAGAAGSLPQVFAVASGFATMIDAMLLALIAFYSSRERIVLTSMTAFLFCLFRPDGLVFVVPLLLIMLVKSRCWRRVRAIVLTFVLPSLLYEAWRLWYFGEPFPLPFLVKTDTDRLLHTLVATSFRTSLVYVTFSAVLIGIVWLFTKSKFRGKSLLVAIVAAPTLFYWCVRLDQNVGFRFFYYLPLGAAIIFALNWQALGPRRRDVIAVGAALWLLLLFQPLRREWRTFTDLQSQDLRQIASDLSRLPSRGTLLSSEAGILPYYSGWASVDPWGLNTPEYAHRFFQPSDVARLSPWLIHTHPNLGESCTQQQFWQVPYARRSWSGLTRNMISGAQAGPYDLWQLSYGSSSYRLRKHWAYGDGDKTCWFVRRGTPLHDAIAAVLAAHHGDLVLGTPHSPPRAPL